MKAIKFHSRQNGFTLIELMIVTAIIGILASIAIVEFGNYQKKSSDKVAVSDARNFMTSAVIANQPE